jgi:two-component system chemotaxis response regulator CheB
LIVVGASSGGIEAMRRVLGRLPSDLAAAVVVVVHTPAEGTGLLADVLTKAGPLPARYAAHGEAIEAGRVYVAAPNRHLLVSGSTLHVTHGPRENRFRPAIDPLFRTAAAEYGARVIGVILSGAQNDGTSGLQIIKEHGGLAVVQQPEDAMMSAMPLSALAQVPVDFVLTAEQIGDRLAELVGQPERNGRRPAGGRPRPSRRELAHRASGHTDPAEAGSAGLRSAVISSPSALTCPDCGGALWERDERGLLRYRCHVGHAYTAEALETAQREAVEAALWHGLRALEESAELRRRLADRARDQRLSAIADGYLTTAADYEARADIIRRVLVGGTEPERTAEAARLEMVEESDVDSDAVR